MSDYSTSPSASSGWPFSDCTIHIQVPEEHGPEIKFIESTCSKFGKIIESFVWDSKRSGIEHVFVMFDSPDAVERAFESISDRSVRLWRSGYWLLRMCGSTAGRLQGILEDRGLTENHRIFGNIPLKWKPRSRHMKSRAGKQRSYHETTADSRYKPYSLDSRPGASTSAQASQPCASHLRLQRREESTPPWSPTRSSSPPVKQELRSPSRKPLVVTPARGMTPAKPPAIVNPPTSVPHTPAPAPAPASMPASSLIAPDQAVLDLETLNRRLQADNRVLVSSRGVSTAKIQNLESENEKLQAQLKSSCERLALLEDRAKHLEGREQALLSKSENDQKATEEAHAKIVQVTQELQVQYDALHAVKIKAESEHEAATKKVTALEAQLADARGQPVARFQTSKPVTVDVSAQTEPARSETEEASSVDPEEVCITPTAPGCMQSANSGKLNLEYFSSLSDAFKEIDNLVRTAFDCHAADSSPSVGTQVTACVGETTFDCS